MAFVCQFKNLIFALAMVAALVGFARAEEKPSMECYSTSQTRDAIVAHKLAEPFASIRAASRLMQADPIGARLCKLGEQLFYEVSLLRRDGRIMRILVDAATGAPSAPRREPGPQGEQSAPARR